MARNAHWNAIPQRELQSLLCVPCIHILSKVLGHYPCMSFVLMSQDEHVALNIPTPPTDEEIAAVRFENFTSAFRPPFFSY